MTIRQKLNDILMALNACDNLGFKYPIGNPELCKTVKKLEASGKIVYDTGFKKWKKKK